MFLPVFVFLVFFVVESLDLRPPYSGVALQRSAAVATIAP